MMVHLPTIHDKLPNIWISCSQIIGRGGTLAWLALSPDLNPVDYLIWGYLRKAVLERINNRKRELIQKLNLVIEKVKNNKLFLRSLRKHFISRYWFCIVVARVAYILTFVSLEFPSHFYDRFPLKCWLILIND